MPHIPRALCGALRYVRTHLEGSLLVKVVALLLQQLGAAQPRSPRSLGRVELGLGAVEHGLKIAVTGVQTHARFDSLYRARVVRSLELIFCLGDKLGNL